MPTVGANVFLAQMLLLPVLGGSSLESAVKTDVPEAS